jgi:hypothetical protein
MWEKEMEKEER